MRFYRRRGLDADIASGEHVNPRRRGLIQLPIHGTVNLIDMLAPDGEFLRAIIGAIPNAPAFGIDFAMPVGAYAAAGTIARIFGAAHRADEPVFVEETLPTFLTPKERFFDDCFYWNEDARGIVFRAGVGIEIGAQPPPQSALKEIHVDLLQLTKPIVAVT